MGENQNFVGFILLIKRKFNKDHIYGLNRVLANIVKKFKNTLHGHPFFLQNSFLQKEKDLPR
jgi:hypothetical protein